MVSTSFLESSAEVSPTTVEVPDDAKEHGSHLLLYVLLPLGALVLIAVMSFLVSITTCISLIMSWYGMPIL